METLEQMGATEYVTLAKGLGIEEMFQKDNVTVFAFVNSKELATTTPSQVDQTELLSAEVTPSEEFQGTTESDVEVSFLNRKLQFLALSDSRVCFNLKMNFTNVGMRKEFWGINELIDGTLPQSLTAPVIKERPSRLFSQLLFSRFEVPI